MKEIEKEFKSGELAYIDAIEALEKIGYSTREAEDIVERWEEENEFD